MVKTLTSKIKELGESKIVPEEEAYEKAYRVNQKMQIVYQNYLKKAYESEIEASKIIIY